VAAWAVNMLAAYQPDILAQLNELGGRMRDAQSSLDAAALRELGRERRTLLASAVDTACSVAEEHGRSISGAVATAVEQTLRAATADEGAAAAVQSGRLLQVLSADGVDTVDLDGAVAVPAAVAAPRTAAPTAAEGKQADTTADVPSPAAPAKPRLQAVRQAPRPVSPSALEKAQAAERAASEAADEAVREAQERRQLQEAAEADFERLATEAKELRAQLKSTEETLERTRQLKEALRAEVKQAGRAADKAQRAAMLARERALRLGNTRS
jgi:flagellar biosynthesis GTPase FlhF